MASTGGPRVASSGGEQETKTRKALEYFAGVARGDQA